jgi:hypothetical protein
LARELLGRRRLRRQRQVRGVCRWAARPAARRPSGRPLAGQRRRRRHCSGVLGRRPLARAAAAWPAARPVTRRRRAGGVGGRQRPPSATS